jgi:hypothetical protein
MTLVEFLLARIDEDEAHVTSAAWATIRQTDPAAKKASAAEHLTVLAAPRVLAECNAKREIVRRCTPLTVPAAGGWPRNVTVTGYTILGTGDETILRLLAAVYADHPDYDESWRP